MLSRVAQRMYWAGRYLERAENSARLINSYANLLLDLPVEAGVDWRQMLRIVAAEESFHARYSKPTEANILKYLVADAENPGSIMSSLKFARENIRTTRDIVPREGWECVNELYLMSQASLAKAVGRRRRHDTLSDCVVRCQQISGLLAGTMSHGAAYRFLLIGHYLERADMNSRVVDVAAATLARSGPEVIPHENTLWMGVLKSLSAYQMYRQFVRRRITGGDVVTFLIKDRRFPMALAFALDAVDGCLDELPHHDAPKTEVVKISDQIIGASLGTIDSESLHDYIDQLQLGFGRVHGAIEATWFLED